MACATPGSWPDYSGSRAPRSLPRILEPMSSGVSETAASRIRQFAGEAGFAVCRTTRATPLHEERARYLTWLAEGRQGAMQWMTSERAERSAQPASVLRHAESVVCVGMPYWTDQRRPSHPHMGKVARYAWGADYHAVLGQR